MTRSVDTGKVTPWRTEMAHDTECRNRKSCALAHVRGCRHAHECAKAHAQEAQHSECWQEADPGADIQMAITFDWELGFMQ
ncbi:hypothetical protein KI387_012653, partial [Taxus chinensis]